MWTIERALVLIRELQPKLHARKYHVALGGGVLNTGQSEKDLDLYVFAFDRSITPPVLPFFETLWGPSEPLANCEDYPPDVNFDTKVKFETPDGRIDLFISRNGVTGEE